MKQETNFIQDFEVSHLCDMVENSTFDVSVLQYHNRLKTLVRVETANL